MRCAKFISVANLKYHMNIKDDLKTECGEYLSHMIYLLLWANFMLKMEKSYADILISIIV